MRICIVDMAVPEMMKVWKGCWKLKEFGSLDVYMHSISGDRERENNI